MRSAARVVVAAFAALLSLLSGPAHAGAAPSQVASVHGYTYDAAVYDEATSYTASEQGPPAARVQMAVSAGRLAVDWGSDRTSARTEGTITHAYTIYERPAHPGHIDKRTGANHRQVGGAGTIHLSLQRSNHAANTAADVARPLSQVEARTLTDALRPDKLSHVFDPKHNFGPLIETYGSEAGAMEQIVRSLDGAGLPSSGIFEVTTQVGGQSVVVRGAVVDGVARIGTAFTP